jgi:aryl-alcohol dehydrogenase-like predicted oxidoreductase
MDFGLNLIDTAPAYESGYSEEIVGAALKGRREGMFVKLREGRQDAVPGHIEPQPTGACSPPSAEAPAMS